MLPSNHGLLWKESPLMNHPSLKLDWGKTRGVENFVSAGLRAKVCGLQGRDTFQYLERAVRTLLCFVEIYGAVAKQSRT
jgi:hypothetical protein